MITAKKARADYEVELKKYVAGGVASILETLQDKIDTANLNGLCSTQINIAHLPTQQAVINKLDELGYKVQSYQTTLIISW